MAFEMIERYRLYHCKSTYIEPEKFTQRKDIIMTVQATESVIECSIAAGFDIVLIEN